MFALGACFSILAALAPLGTLVLPLARPKGPATGEVICALALRARCLLSPAPLGLRLLAPLALSFRCLELLEALALSLCQGLACSLAAHDHVVIRLSDYWYLPVRDALCPTGPKDLTKDIS